MRSESGLDQAEGLRRLLVGDRIRVISVAAGKPGVGCTSATINLVAALAYYGKDVLVLNENAAPNNLLDQLGLSVRFDLLDVAQAKCSLSDAMLSGKGYAVLNTARAMQALPEMANSERQRLGQALVNLNTTVDVVLVDAAIPGMRRVKGLSAQDAVSSSLTTGTSMLVVADVTASGITASYALIKRMALENARLRFEIIVNKAGNNEEARKVFDNMAKVARHHLSAHLEYLGCIPTDNKLVRATQLGRSVVEAFPDACSARAYLALARKLLCLPVNQDEREDGIECMLQSLLRQARNSHVNRAEDMLTM